MKLYRCPSCKRTITEEKYLKELESGRMGYCYCKFSEIDEKGKVWFPRILVPMDEYVKVEKK